jgi:hypothetical protein
MHVLIDLGKELAGLSDLFVGSINVVFLEELVTDLIAPFFDEVWVMLGFLGLSDSVDLVSSSIRLLSRLGCRF